MDSAARKHSQIVPAAHLTVVWTPDPQRIGNSVPIGPLGLRVGRGAHDSACLALPSEDRRASRDHFRMEWRHGQLAIRDSGSSNGTTVDGVPLPSGVVVVPPDGAVIRAGDTLMVMREGEAGPCEGVDSWVPGPSPSACSVRAAIDELAASPMAPVLLLGEAGVGKEMAARRLHAANSAEDAPWVHVWCGETTRSREVASVLGRAANARGGTLYLEDVVQLDAAMQRALLGAIRWWSTEGALRVIGAATELPGSSLPANLLPVHPLLNWLASGRTVQVPPLRTRREDIPALAAFMLARRSVGPAAPPLCCWDPDSVEALLLYSYARNLHDLGEIIAMAALNAHGATRLEPAHLPGSVLASWKRARAGAPCPVGAHRRS